MHAAHINWFRIVELKIINKLENFLLGIQGLIDELFKIGGIEGTNECEFAS